MGFVPTIHPSGRDGKPGSVLLAATGVNICDPSAFLMLDFLPIRNWLCGGQVEIGFGPTLPLEIQSTSGDVALQRAGGDVTAKLVSGDLWIRDAGASVHANTVSGDQRLEAVLGGTVDANAISGDVYVGVRRGSRVYVDANTVSGTTSSELDLSDAPQEAPPDADAPMVEVRAKTVSGDIMIARAPAPAQLPRG